MNFKVIVDHQG